MTKNMKIETIETTKISAFILILLEFKYIINNLIKY